VKLVDLGTLGGRNSGAVAINASGQVAGTAETTDQEDRAFSWTEASGMLPIGTFGGNLSSATAVSASGEVVGGAAAGINEGYAFTWTQGGGLTDLGTLGGISSRATAVNNDGQIVGIAATAEERIHAFSWTPETGMVDLGTFGGQVSEAKAVNDAGQVVGLAETPKNEVRGFSWTRTGGMVALGTLGGNLSVPYAVNASGEVVGVSTTATGEEHAFSWTQAGGMVDLGTLGGSYSAANAVSASGQVVGAATLSDGEERAFSWTPGQGMIDLGSLGGKSSDATAVNDGGRVVGRSLTSAGEYQAFFWTPQDGLVALPGLGGTSAEASAVNNSGWIVGHSYIRDGESHAVLWEPTPTPPSLSTDKATGVAQTIAKLTATVIPEGSAVTACYFEYGTSETYGKTAACSPLPGAGEGVVPVSAAITGLDPSTTYHFRIVATNEAGTAYGLDQAFSTAAPALPELGRCVSLPTANGKYKTAACTTKSTNEDTGKFEWQPWPTQRNDYSFRNGAAKLETTGKTTITCTENTLRGDYTGSETASMFLRLGGCELHGRPNTICQSTDAGAGEIVSDELHAELGFITAATKPTVGWAIHPAIGTTIATFECDSTQFVLAGRVVATVAKLDKMVAAFTLKFKATKGKQEPESLLSVSSETLHLEAPEATEQAGLTAADSISGEEAFEIKAIP
jgi:probable HAF family extracellular repeat protein